jgi:catechol 2,3-dioxygenase-like lactoylglutathione lyase family enzyme
MKVNALDHVNIITDDLAGTIRFFVEMFDLDVRDAPPPLPPEHYQWLYDDNNRAIFHINSKSAPQAFQRETPRGPATGAIHHVALACTSHAGFVARLTEHGIDFRTNDIPSVNLRQIFFSEPNGVLLELNFFGD